MKLLKHSFHFHHILLVVEQKAGIYGDNRKKEKKNELKFIIYPTTPRHYVIEDRKNDLQRSRCKGSTKIYWLFSSHLRVVRSRCDSLLLTTAVPANKLSGTHMGTWWLWLDWYTRPRWSTNLESRSNSWNQDCPSGTQRSFASLAPSRTYLGYMWIA